MIPAVINNPDETSMSVSVSYDFTKHFQKVYEEPVQPLFEAQGGKKNRLKCIDKDGSSHQYFQFTPETKGVNDPSQTFHA